MTQLLALTALLLATAASAAPLTESSRLAAVYDSILRARFGEAETRLDTACPPAPIEACLVLREAALWWRIRLDPFSRALDPKINAASATAIAAADRWVTRQPQRAEAWFYLAGAYAPLTEWRILRGERLAAARDAKRIKDALERATMLDATLQDAYFGVGMYHYYADVAPAALKLLRFLLLMPGGNRVQGLREMEQARASGVLLTGEADYQMHYVYLWYEHDHTTALRLLRGLDARYPTNPLFLQRIAEVEHDYRKDLTAARAAWQQLLARAEVGGVELAAITNVRARLGLGSVLVDSGDSTRAIETVSPIITSAPAAPYGAIANAHVIIARAAEHLGDLARAITALDQAIAHAPSDDPERIRSRARAMRSRLGSANH